MTYLAGEILVHLIGAFLAGLALGWVIWGLGRRGGDAPRHRRHDGNHPGATG